MHNAWLKLWILWFTWNCVWVHSDFHTHSLLSQKYIWACHWVDHARVRFKCNNLTEEQWNATAWTWLYSRNVLFRLIDIVVPVYINHLWDSSQFTSTEGLWIYYAKPSRILNSVIIKVTCGMYANTACPPVAMITLLKMSGYTTWRGSTASVATRLPPQADGRSAIWISIAPPNILASYNPWKLSKDQEVSYDPNVC